MIEINNLNKYYGTFQVLKDCSTFIEKGSVVVICGPSGSGKSTLIKCINGLEPFSSGEIIVDDMNVGKLKSDLPKLRAKIGMVFQNFELFPHLNILDNMLLAQKKVLKRSVLESEEKAMMLLKRIGLTDQRNKYPGQLSGGQQQRVAIARALAMRPKVMLLDEITSALDPEVVGEVLNVIRSLNKEHSLTMIMVTHQMGFAREISDRVCFFNEGKIFEQGAPEQLFGDPQNERTKQFLHAVLDAN